MADRMCLVMEISGENRVFLVDLKADDGGELVEKRPNFAVSKACFGVCDAYVGDGFLYIFCTGCSTSYFKPEVYKVELRPFWDRYDVKLDMTMVEKAPSILGSKSIPRVIPYVIKGYGTVFIIFSSMIMCCHNSVDDGVEIDVNDFELYDPRGVFSRKLPQLNVRPKKRSSTRSFLLLSSQTREFLPTRHVFNEHRFRVTSFGLNEDNDLFIQASFGTIFYLPFKDGKKWMVWGESTEFASYQMNFVSRRYGLHIDSYGINDFTGKYVVDFPKSSMDDGLQHDSNRMGLLGQNSDYLFPIVSQIGYEATFRSLKKMFCYVDVFFVNLAARRKEANACKEANVSCSMKMLPPHRIKSIKFSLKDELVLYASMVGMYPL